MPMATPELYQGIIIAKSEQLSDMWLKLWLITNKEWQCAVVDLNSKYTLQSPVDIGDFVHLYDNGGQICKLPNESNLPRVCLSPQSNVQSRKCLKVSVNLMPMDFLLFPAAAKEKNLRMAMTAELGPIPIATQNNFSLHRFYEGMATLFFEKKDQERTIEHVYDTPWLICVDASRMPIASRRSNVVNALKFCQGLGEVCHHGLVVDASLRDVFFVHCAGFSELVSLRKDITDGRIEVGDWVEFVSLDVKEAEKSDERRQIYPTEQDKMIFFHRTIACFPNKIKPVFPTCTSSGGKLQLFVDIEVPTTLTMNNRIYVIERLGKVNDPKRLVDFKEEGRTISVLVQCNVNIEQNYATFDICDTKQRHHFTPPAPPLLPPAPRPAASPPTPTPRPAAPPPAPTPRPAAPPPTPTPRPAAPPPAPTPRPAAPPPTPPTLCRPTFLQSIDRHSQQQQKQPKVPVTDENADPKNGSAFRQQQQQKQQQLSLSPPPQLASTKTLVEPPSPSGSLAPTCQKRPSNSIALETVVVEEVVLGRGAHSSHVFCYCFDYSQKPNSYIIRIGLNEIDKLPTLGQWVRVVMKMEVYGKRVDYRLWEAGPMREAKYETDFSLENGVRSVLVRVPLKVSGDGFYNQCLGPVSDIAKRLKMLPGCERRSVNAWCRKMMPLSVCCDGICHWEIAPLPEEEWLDQCSVELPLESKTTFKIPFVGSRYRTQQTTATTAKQETNMLTSAQTPLAIVLPSQQPQKQQPMAITKPNQQQCGTRVSPALDSSGFGSSASSNSSEMAERDLIDLFGEKCSVRQLKQPQPPTPPLPLRHQFDDVTYPHTGVIASVDLKSSGYYVYSNEFDNELYLETEELLEKGTWIKFNTNDNYYRLSIGRYAKMKRSPFDVRVERNTIYMCVSAIVTDEALALRVINTFYVKNAYDQHRLLRQAHVGKSLKLEVVRGKVDGFCWAISKIMRIDNSSEN